MVSCKPAAAAFCPGTSGRGSGPGLPHIHVSAPWWESCGFPDCLRLPRVAGSHRRPRGCVDSRDVFLLGDRAAGAPPPPRLSHESSAPEGQQGNWYLYYGAPGRGGHHLISTALVPLTVATKKLAKKPAGNEATFLPHRANPRRTCSETPAARTRPQGPPSLKLPLGAPWRMLNPRESPEGRPPVLSRPCSSST